MILICENTHTSLLVKVAHLASHCPKHPVMNTEKFSDGNSFLHQTIRKQSIHYQSQRVIICNYMRLNKIKKW